MENITDSIVNSTDVNFEDITKTSNITEKPDEGAPVLPVFGLPGKTFYIIHISAITSLSISIVVSSGVLYYLFVKTKGSFWKRHLGERLVVYLAICDLGFSCT